MRITTIPATAGAPARKLADVDLEFDDGPLDGLTLVGFGIWSSRTNDDAHVSLPARTNVVNGERRSFALLRPLNDSAMSEDLTRRILDAYRQDRAATAAR